MSDTLQTVHTQGLTFWREFKKFAIRGNVVDLSIGIIIGTAFTAITTSLVKDIIMPPLGLLLADVDFTNLFIDLSGTNPATLAAAQSAGVATINYGLFINAIIDFLIIALVVFILVKYINRLKRQDAAATEKKCPFCISSIDHTATRCPHCTSQL